MNLDSWYPLVSSCSQMHASSVLGKKTEKKEENGQKTAGAIKFNSFENVATKVPYCLPLSINYIDITCLLILKSLHPHHAFLPSQSNN